MGRIAIMTDSNSGITRDQATGLGVSVLPMPFNMNEETYFEGVNLSREVFYGRLDEGVVISTSQPSIESVQTLWEELLKTHDEVIHIPMSSGLSGSCETAIMLARDFDGKVKVVDNQRISVTQRQSVLDAVELVKAGKTAEEVKGFLEETRLESSIYIMVDTLKYLKRGGRVTPAAAALGTFLKIKPILQIHGEKLDAFAKARTIKQAKTIMMDAVRKDIETRFGGMEKGNENVCLQIAHTNNQEAAEEFKEEMLGLFPEFKDAHVDELSLSVACHIGPGSLAFACTKRFQWERL